MNSWLHFIHRKTSQAIFAFSPTSSTYDHITYCYNGFHIRFEHDYNIKPADVFLNEITSITLFAFDKSGDFITSKTESRGVLKNKNYMVVDIALGEYHPTRWAELVRKSFQMTETVCSNLSLLQFKCGNKKYIHTYLFTNLHSLWYGEIESVNVGILYEDITIPLVKDTKQIHVMLRQINKLPVTSRDFRFKITDDNSLRNYDNSIFRTG